MRASTFLPHFVLGLLSSLIAATASVHVPRDGSPVLTTLEYPFTLIARSPASLHVVLNNDGRLVATVDKRPSTPFRLTDGTLTVLSSGLAAVYGPVALPLPPLVIPVVIVKKPQPDSKIPFLAVTNNDPGNQKSTLRLTTLGDPLVVRFPLGVQNAIYVKPEGNIEPTEDLILEIVPVQ